MTAIEAPPAAPPRRAPLSVGGVILRLSVLAFIVRALYIVMYAKDLKLGWDATWYTGIADSLAAGHGYSVTCPVITTCVVHQTALFPPVLPTLFAAAAKVGISSMLGRGLLLALIGSVTVYVIGLIGYRVGGREVAIAAAVVAALNPMMIILDGALMSEGVATLLSALLMLLLIDQIRAVRTWRWFAMGTVVGLAALTRGEGPLWLIIILGPSLFFLTVVGLRSRVRGLLIAAATMVVVVSPWMIRNQYQFGTAYLGQPNLYGTLAATNCDAGYHGANIGAWTCRSSADAAFGDFGGKAATEQVQYDEARHRAVSYATKHISRWPVVVIAREARTWSVLGAYHFQTGLPKIRFSVTLYDWFLFVGTLVGIGLALKRRLTIWPLLLLLLSVTLTIAVAYGNPRYLATAEPALAVFTGIALAPLFRPRPRPQPSGRVT
ncbi:MAG TPA: hypothetical protein VIK61_00195 [Acidimicrobiia bacterium]